MFEKFAERVKERTGGRLVIKVYPGGSLGYPAAQTARVVRDGFVEMGDGTYAILGGDFPLAGINNLPFLATTYEQARKVDLATRAILSEEWKNKFNAYVVWSFTWPTQQLFANFQAPTVKDWTGKKIRIYSPETDALVRDAGGTPVSMPLTELYVALSRGVVDAYITGSINIKPYKLYEVTKFTNLGSFAVVGPSHVIVNAAAFDALPADVQNAVKQVARELEPEHWKLVEEKDAEWLAELPGLGTKTVNILPEEIAKLEGLSRPRWDEWAQKNAPLGPKVMELARKATGK